MGTLGGLFARLTLIKASASTGAQADTAWTIFKKRGQLRFGVCTQKNIANNKIKIPRGGGPQKCTNIYLDRDEESYTQNASFANDWSYPLLL